MGSVLALKRGPRRVKHTAVPPELCTAPNCVWKAKHKKLTKLHRQLRMELLKVVAERAEESRAREPEGEAVLDLYEVLNGDD